MKETRDYFCDQQSYEHYLKLVEVGKELNKLIEDKKYLVFDNDMRPVEKGEKFVFEFFDEPTVGLLSASGKRCYSYTCDVSDEGGIYIGKIEFKQDLKRLQSFSFIPKKQIKKIAINVQ